MIDLRPGGGLHPAPTDDPFTSVNAWKTEPKQPVEFPDMEYPETEDALSGHGWSWLMPLLGLLVSLGWITAMLWRAWRDLALLDPVGLTVFIAALCVPPALVGVLLILLLRNGRAEARRFGNTARAMREEAASLEHTVALLSRSIEASRVGLAEQSTLLTSIGDAAVAQLAGVTSGMTEQIARGREQTALLAEAATGAHGKLNILLALLPRAHGETNDIAALLDRVGIAASEHAAGLDAQLVALADRGREADTVANGAAQKLAAHIARMEATSETAGARLEQVTGDMSVAVDGLLGRTADAVDEARKGIAAQGEAMLAMLGINQAALDRTARDSAEALAGRIIAIEEIIDRIAARLGEQRATSGTIVEELGTGIDRVSGQLDALHRQGIDRSQALAASISALGGSADAMTEALKIGDTMASGAIGTTDRLLVALDAAAREIDETLPGALARLDQRIGESRKVVIAAKPELLALVTAAESTHDAIEAIAQVIATQRDTVDRLAGTLLETLDDGKVKADKLGQMVEETIGRTHRFSEEAAPQLVDALLRVRDTASAAADQARDTLATVIPEAAAALEQESAAAMRRATSSAVDRQIMLIAEASDAAADAAAQASDRLSHQLRAIADATAIVETRFADARAERDHAQHDSFARRVSLLIDTLNSASIDITKSFAPDISDSAWAAYLKGDRGVFTRRAVRLLDAGEARDILRFYDDDVAFRDQVNRYIHDFEAMLRAILAERDGSPLAITLLSSDMGKLYVSLAQAIERLRT